MLGGCPRSPGSQRDPRPRRAAQILFACLLPNVARLPDRRVGAPIRSRTSCRGALALWRESPVEGLALSGHLDKKPGRLEAGPVLLLQRLAQLDETLGAHHIDP